MGTQGYDNRDPRGQYGDPRNDPRNDSRYADPRANDHRGDPRGGTPQGAAPPQQQQRRDDRAPAQDEIDMSGTWPCRAAKHRFGEAGTGNIQIGVRVRFTGGKFGGKMCNWYATFTDRAEESTLRGMDALGFRGGEDIFDCRGFYDPQVQSEIVDAEAVVEYQRNPKTGRMANKVTFINGGDIAMAKDLTQADEQRFRQRMRATLARRGGPGPRAPANQPPPSRPAPQQQQSPPRDRPREQQQFGNDRGGGQGGNGYRQPDPWDDQRQDPRGNQTASANPQDDIPF